jgi:hypothetical protein
MIFQSEETVLNSHVASLLFQNQIEEHQQLAEHYRELATKREASAAALIAAQEQANSNLMSLKSLVEKCKEVAPGAIASLRTAVLSLFDSEGSGETNEPMVPTPDLPVKSDIIPPTGETDVENSERSINAVSALLEEGQESEDTLLTPGAIVVDELEGGSFGIVIGRNNIGISVDYLGIGDCPNPAADKNVWFDWKKDRDAIASLSKSAHDQIKMLTTEELLQFLDWDKEALDNYWDGKWFEQPGCSIRWGGATIERWIVVIAFSYEWASPFASLLGCQLWEDAPLLGQYCTVIFEDSDADNQLKPRLGLEDELELVEVNTKVAYLKARTGEIKATYAGFTRKDYAKAWGELLTVTYDIASGFEVRLAKHLPFKWELKLWDMNINQIQKLAAEDLTKSPRAGASTNTAKPPAKKSIILDEDRIVVGQRIRTKVGQILEVSSTLGFDKTFFAKDLSDHRRQMLKLADVEEFLEASDQVVPATQDQSITLGALVRRCTNPKFSIFEYGIVQEISESEAKVWSDETSSSTTVAIADLELISADPQYARIINPNSELKGQSFVVVRTTQTDNNLGYSLLAPKGIIWFNSGDVEILDTEVEENALPTEPAQVELPIYQRSDGPFEVDQVVQERAGLLEVGDVVEIIGDRHPRHFGLIGTVESSNHLSNLPIAVRSPQGVKGYLRSDLKLLRKGEAQLATTTADGGEYEF